MFVPRLENDAPSATDKYWIQVGSGGYNPCIYVRGNSVLPNCVGFVYGRFMEIMGTTSCNLGNLNGGEFWGNTADGYERGQSPRLGAIACWRRPGAAGHVAIVEQINTDGSIVTSNSAYNSTRYYMQTLYPPKYTWSDLYIFQGFIYNPTVSGYNGSMLTGFIDEAKSHVGEKVSDLTGTIRRKSSTDFVMYCAGAIPGLIDVVIPKVESCSDLAAIGPGEGYGLFLPGKTLGLSATAVPGDIVLLRTSEVRKYPNKTDCDELAIIAEVNDNVYTTVAVGESGNVRMGSLVKGANRIAGYYRPRWDKVQNSISATMGYTQLGKFYDTENTKEDATIREVAYIADNKYTTTKSNVKLSVVNYTTMLSAFLDDLLVPSVYSGNAGTSVITDGITDRNARIVVDYLISKGLPASAACGVAGNIQHESGFRTDAKGDYEGGMPTSFGICQWHYGRGDNMKKMAGSNWSNNLTGQLDYLWYELQTGYTGVLGVLMEVPDNDTGVRTAADTFVRKFEVPANVDAESVNRQNTALALWNQIVVVMNTISSGASSVLSGAGILSGTTVEIPDWVGQDGISNIYTNYSYWFSRWAGSSIQRKVADMWAARGKRSNRNIATIDGYYLIAVKPVFGTNGDKVSVVLDDGTVINAIIADIKGNENGTTGAAVYGHTINNKTNVIEWETIGPTTSVYMTGTTDLTGWKGKAVKKIINGGSIL